MRNGVVLGVERFKSGDSKEHEDTRAQLSMIGPTA
jgi:hypothetical protein